MTDGTTAGDEQASSDDAIDQTTPAPSTAQTFGRPKKSAKRGGFRYRITPDTSGSTTVPIFNINCSRRRTTCEFCLCWPTRFEGETSRWNNRTGFPEIISY